MHRSPTANPLARYGKKRRASFRYTKPSFARGTLTEAKIKICIEYNQSNMKLIAALGVVAAAPGVSAALRNNSNYECVGSTLGPGQSLGPNQFICDPSNDSNRFGMTFMGMPALYNMDGKMVWWAATRGTNLTLNPASSILELLGEGVDKWNSGCIGAKKPNRVALEDGGVKVYDKNGAIVWSVDNQGMIYECYPEPETVRGPFECIGRSIKPNEVLNRKQFICDPTNSSRRFGISVTGKPQLHWDDRLVWQSDASGDSLFFSKDTAELSLRDNKTFFHLGAEKWSTMCENKGLTGKKVKITPYGVWILDITGEVIWHLNRIGEVEVACEKSQLPSGPVANPVAPAEEVEIVEETAEQGQMVEPGNSNEILWETNDFDVPEGCNGFSLKAGEKLLPNEWICDPNDPSKKFGLSVHGMPNLWHGDHLLWFAPARGSKLVLQKDAHFVLYGEGLVKWSSACYGNSGGKEINFIDGGIVLLDEDFNNVWRIDSNGTESGCFPGGFAGSYPGLSSQISPRGHDGQ